MPAKLNFMKQVVSMLILILLVNTISAQKLKPWKVKLETGQKFKVINNSSSNISQQMMGQEIQIKINNDITDSMYVKSESSGSFNISKTTIHMKMDMDAMGQQKNVDSDNKEDMEGELGEKLKEKIGVAVDATVTEKGAVIITSTVKEMTTDAMGGLMSLNNDSASIAGYFLAPPAKDLRPGDTWIDSVVITGNRMETIYTFIKSEKRIAYFSFELKTSTEGTTSTNGMEVKSKINSDGKGTMQVELKSGLVLERTTETKVSGTSEIMGMEIPMTGETKATVTITKL